jgi:hypothetical protein
MRVRCRPRTAGAASFWAPYLAALPAAYPDPLWWPADARSALAATPLAAAVDDQAAALRELAQRWGPRLVALCGPALPPCAAEAMRHEGALRWARSTVATRAFLLPLAGAAGAAMVPVGDLLDHDPFCGADWRDEARGGDDASADAEAAAPPLRIATPVALPAGAAPTLNYGGRSNAQLLLTCVALACLLAACCASHAFAMLLITLMKQIRLLFVS